MSDKIEEKRGLQHCYFRENGKLYSIEKGKPIILKTENKNEFVVDERCVGGKTTNPKHTIENARWAFIYDVFFQSLEKAKPGDITDNLWGPLSGGTAPISKYGLGLKYKVGSTFLFNPSSYSYYYGFMQRVELFSESPGTGFYFYVIPITKSNICYAYFNKSEDIKHYGDNVNLEIMLHGYNLDKKNKYRGKVYLIEEDKAKGLKETDQFEDNNLWKEAKTFNISQIDGYSSNSNAYYRTSFPIEVGWKKNQTAKKNFTIILEIYKYHIEPGMVYGTNEKEERVVFRNFADEPTTDMVEYDAKILGIKDIDSKKSISSRFIVSEELMDNYISRVEKGKNITIQYIGDIQYNHREFDPCGYSKITIQDKEDKERDPLVIFDENDTLKPIDRTSQLFTLIAGDTRKDVTITLGNLKTQNQYCQGLLLDDGQKHTENKNVFQVDKVYSALNNGAARRDDATHQQQQKEAGIITTQENKNDTDVVKTDRSYNPTAVQQWKDGTDYQIKSDSEIILKLKYLYNKTAFEYGQQVYKKEIDPNNNSIEALNMLWLFRYFNLADELAQIFFLPISTCRYPNQIAKIKVYPDIEWEIAFLITIGAGYSGSIKYERQRMNGIHRGYGFKYLKDDLQIKNTKSSNLGWAIMGKCAVNGKEHSLGFEGVKRTVDVLVTTFNSSREVLEVLSPDGTNPADSAAVSKKIIDIDFSIDPPNIGFALSKKFGEATTKQIVPIYKGGFRADPFIGITISVDLVPIFGKAGLIGKIIQWIIDSIAYLTDSEIYITFEAGLAVKFDFTLSYNRIDGLDGKKESEQLITVEVPISVKAGCKSNDVVTIAAVTRGGRNFPEQKLEKWKVEGQLSTTFTFTKTYGYDKDMGKQYEKSKGVWNPAEITITCYEITTSKITGQPKKSDKFKLFEEKTLFDNPKTYTDEEPQKK
jgi:hypothetical protein